MEWAACGDSEGPLPGGAWVEVALKAAVRSAPYPGGQETASPGPTLFHSSGLLLHPLLTHSRTILAVLGSTF